MTSVNLFSIEAEQEIIGAVLSNPASLDDALEIVNVSDFYHVQHQRIMSELIRQKDSGEPVEAAQIAIALMDSSYPDDGHRAIELAANSTGYTNVKSYALIVSERAKLRRLREALIDSVDNITPDKSISDVIDFAQSRLIELDSKKFNDEIQHSDDVLKNMLKTIDQRFRDKQSGKLGGLSTGLKALDERFNGLRPGHLIVLAARPSMGKSALAMQFAQHAALIEKKGVLVFSLEMPTEELFERMTSTQGNLPYKRIRDGDLLEEDWTKLAAAVSKLKGSNIRVVDAPSLHINQIRAYARKAHRKGVLGLIVVDHINIAKGNGNGREQEVASVSGGLKALAKEIGCPVLALCQLNRDVESKEDKRPLMSHLRESGAIEQDADIVTFIYRDDYYNENSQNKGVVELITRKFRGGQNGTDYIINKLDVMRFENMSENYVTSYEPVKSKKFNFNN